MKIELKSWMHTCEDGCCFRTGYDVFLNGNKIGSTEGEDTEELADILNDYYSETKSLEDIIKIEKDLTRMFDSDTRVAMALLETIRNLKS